MEKIEVLKSKITKLAIVGFAPTWNQAPFDDHQFEIWGLNELYKYFEKIPNGRADRWFEIHSRNSPSKSIPQHQEWLKKCPVPLYMWEHYKDIPNSVKFPKDELIKWLGDAGGRFKDNMGNNYFTNTISWMTAFALYLGFEEIHIYGVDMACDSEYQWQRPSCEFFLGLAKGMGVKIYLPQNSDLLKTGQLYGFESDNQLRIKMKARIQELQGRKKISEEEIQKAQQVIQHHTGSVNQLVGAIEDCKYWIKNWVG